MIIQSVCRTQISPKSKKTEIRKALKSIMSNPNLVYFGKDDQKIEVIMRICPDERLVLHNIHGIPSDILANFN